MDRFTRSNRSINENLSTYRELELRAGITGGHKAQQCTLATLWLWEDIIVVKSALSASDPGVPGRAAR